MKSEIILKKVGSWLLIFAVGFLLGEKLGITSGAGGYIKKLWEKNEIQISESGLFDKVNRYRQNNQLNSLDGNEELCSLAQFTANTLSKTYADEESLNEFANIFEGDKNEEERNQLKKEWEVKWGFIPTEEKVKELCPKCVFQSVAISHFRLNELERCFYIGKSKCDPKEKFFLKENLTNRILNDWSNVLEDKEVLLAKVKKGCVKTLGNISILVVADFE